MKNSNNQPTIVQTNDGWFYNEHQVGFFEFFWDHILYQYQFFWVPNSLSKSGW
jgi:hypothetical protein